MYLLGISIGRVFPFIRFGKNHIESRNTVQIRKKYCNRGNILKVKGENNIIKSYGSMQKSNIRIEGNGNRIIIESNCKILETSFVVIGDNSSIILREGTSCGRNCWMVVMGKNKHIAVGRDVMIADDVDLWASDSHAIIDVGPNGITINPSGNIDIANHVWIGKKAVLLKNVNIGENAIVGMASVVTKDVPSSSIVVGNPARVVKNGVNWDRKHIQI